MPRPKYDGDGLHVLPAKTAEPYRLWHAFVIAARRMNLTLHPDYEDWGDFEREDFRPWFYANWERLFAATTELRRLEPGTEVPSEGHGRGISVFIPLEGVSASKIQTQLEMLLREHFVQDDDGQRPTFSRWNVTGNYERGMKTSLPETRRYLRLLNNWITANERGEIEPLCKAVIWTINQSETYRYVREEIGIIPNSYERYASYIAYLAAGGKRNARSYDGLDDDPWDQNAEYYRREVAKDLAKAKKIAENVAFNKQFPGEY